jgi:signal transduction histidine kinase
VASDRTFAQLVSLACHDLRTPLAAVHGFARTIDRLEPLQARTRRYIGIMVEGSGQLAQLLERLALIARIERGAYQPALQQMDSLELAQKAAELVAAGEVRVAGEGETVEVDPAPTEQTVAAFLTCALRHGDSEELDCAVRGRELSIRPVTGELAAILLGEDLRDFGAAAARIHVEALGGSVAVQDDALLVRLPPISEAGTAAGP